MHFRVPGSDNMTKEHYVRYRNVRIIQNQLLHPQNTKYSTFLIGICQRHL